MSEDTCVWPGCEDPRDDPALPICSRHARDVHTHVQRHLLAPRPDAVGVIYYLLVGDLVKIGFTANLRARMLDYPPHSVLLAVEPGTKDIEARRHREFRNSLARSKEWFTRTPDLAVLIAQLVVDHGEPKMSHYPVSRRGHSQKYPVTVTHVGT